MLRISVLVLLCAAAPAFAAGLTSSEKAAVDAAANDTLRALAVPAATLAVVKDGQIVYAQAYGIARPPAVKATPDMAFPIGSVSKQFTAATILSLADKGKLSLDDKVGKYFPDLSGADQASLRQLLSHTAGYEDDAPEDYSTPAFQKPVDPEAAMQDWGKRPLDFKPGTEWQYSNTGYTIAALIAQKAGGAPFFAQERALIADRLGLRSFADYNAQGVPPGGPVGYQRAALAAPRPAPIDGHGWSFGSGQLAMTASDLARWDISLIDRSVLSAADYESMETPVKLANGEDTHYGLGVQLRDVSGRHSVYHSGEETGFTAYNEVFPAQREAVAVLVNEDATPAAQVIARQIEHVLFGVENATGGNAAERKVAALLGQLQTGRIDQAALNDNLRAYFSPTVLQDYQSSLGLLGPILSLSERKHEARGGMMFHVYDVAFLRRRAVVTTYELPDGRLDQLLVEP